jgi:hypothetical protein
MKTITVPIKEEILGQLPALPSQIRRFLPGIAQLPQALLAADILVVPDQVLPFPAQRLIVLIPAGEIDEQALARRVWQLASCCGLSVLYLALSPDQDQVSYQRRRLAHMAAMTAYPHVQADTKVHLYKNWSEALRHFLKPGDLLVCLADDHPHVFFRRKPLAQQLSANLGVPIYQLGGLQVKPSPLDQYRIKNIFAWIASIALISAFFWLQVGIDRASGNPQSTILLCMSILVELYGLWKINEWIG